MNGWTEKYGADLPPVAAPADWTPTPPAALLDPGQAHLHDPTLLADWFTTLARTVAVDFDGTLHPYTEGWKGSVPEDEPPLPGAAEFLRTLVEDLGYLVVVFSVRADHVEGLDGITAWLAHHDLLRYVVKVTHLKPAAFAYVDDRGVTYAGDWAEVLNGVARLADAPAHGAPPVDIPSVVEAAERAVVERYHTDPVFHALVHIFTEGRPTVTAAKRVQAVYDALDSIGYEITGKEKP